MENIGKRSVWIALLILGAIAGYSLYLGDKQTAGVCVGGIIGVLAVKNAL